MLDMLAQAANNGGFYENVGVIVSTALVVLGGREGIGAVKQRWGNGTSDKPCHGDVMTRKDCAAQRAEEDKHRAALQALRDAQEADRHKATLAAIGEIKSSVEKVHQRVDELYEQRRGPTP